MNLRDIIGSEPYNRLREQATADAQNAAKKPDSPLADAPMGLVAPKKTEEPGHTLDVVPQTQNGNGCGTTSLAMALTYVLGRPVSQAEIDAQVRVADVFSSASNLRNAARSHGVDARLVNNLSAREVTRELDRGHPIIFLSDLTPNTSADVAAMHYRVIDGYRWKGDTLELRIADPWGMPRYWRSWDSLQPEWANIKGLGLELGYNRFGVVVGKSANDNTLPRDRLSGVLLTEPIADAAADVLNDGARVRDGKWTSVFSGAFHVMRGLVPLYYFPLRRVLGGRIDRSNGNDVATPGSVPSSAPVRWAEPPTSTESKAREAVRAPSANPGPQPPAPSATRRTSRR